MPRPEFDLQPERSAKLLLVVIPNCCLKVLCLSFISGLVKLSATISALGIKLTIISFRSYKSRILQQLTSIYLDRLWIYLLPTSASAAWLSPLIQVGKAASQALSSIILTRLRQLPINIVSPRSLNSYEIQRPSFTQIDNTIYSALVVKVATDFCFRLIQDTGPPANIQTQARIDFLSTKSIAQSESENPVII